MRVEKKIRPVLDGKGDDGIGFSAGKSGAELSIVAKKIVCLLLGRGFRPGGHPGGMAGGAGENDWHGSLQSFQRFGIIFVGNFVEQGKRPEKQGVNADRIKRADIDV